MTGKEIVLVASLLAVAILTRVSACSHTEERTEARTEAPTSTPTPTAEYHPRSQSEQQRLDSWDGTGDTPYGDGPNDGRFSDVTCSRMYGTCTYDDGTKAAENIRYHDGRWWWDSHPISWPGECPTKRVCIIVWNHANTWPEVESVS